MEVKQIQAIQPNYKSTMPLELIETPDLFQQKKTIDQILEEEDTINMEEYQFKSPQIEALYKKFKSN